MSDSEPSSWRGKRLSFPIFLTSPFPGPSGLESPSLDHCQPPDPTCSNMTQLQQEKSPLHLVRGPCSKPRCTQLPAALSAFLQFLCVVPASLDSAGFKAWSLADFNKAKPHTCKQVYSSKKSASQPCTARLSAGFPTMTLLKSSTQQGHSRIKIPYSTANTSTDLQLQCFCGALAAGQTYKAHKNTGFALTIPPRPPCISSPIYRNLKQACSKAENYDW